MGLGLDVRVDPGVVGEGTCVRLEGRLDALSASVARTALHDAVDAGTGELILDLADLEIRDGVGLGVLIGTARRAQRCHRVLVLTGVNARQLRLLRATRLAGTARIESAALVG